MKRTMNQTLLSQFQGRLMEDERSAATVEKYLRDLRAFYAYIGENGAVTKDDVIAYKQHLTERYAPASVNSMLAALNRGHSNINTTRIYIITTGQEHRCRLDALGLVIWQKSKCF